MKRPKTAPEIPDEFVAIAAEYGLTIVHNWTYGSRFYVEDKDTVATLLQYTEREFMFDLTAERLTADIEQAIDNYEPAPIDHQQRLLDYELKRRGRHSPITGHWR